MNTPSGFDAFGHPVPPSRRSAALRAIRDMVPGVSLASAMEMVDRVAMCIERDDPYDALANATHAAAPVHVSSPQFGVPPDVTTSWCLDVTGGYRLIAHLCCDDKLVIV